MLTYKLGMKGVDYGRRQRDLSDLGRDGCEAVGTLARSSSVGQAFEVAASLKKASD